MPRNASPAALEAALQQITDEIWLVTLDISHPDWVEDFHFINDNLNHNIGGTDYLGFPFSPVFPEDSADKPPRMQLRVDNISKEIIDELRAVNHPPTFNLCLRLASQLTVIEMGPIELSSQAITYDKNAINIPLASRSLSTEPYPSLRFTPVYWKGLFK